MSDELSVNIRLILVSALSQLLFISVKQEYCGTTNALMKIYAEDGVTVAEHWEELQGTLDEWKELL